MKVDLNLVEVGKITTALIAKYIELSKKENKDEIEKRRKEEYRKMYERFSKIEDFMIEYGINE